MKITIAIDGFSSCGKSALAKALAKELGYGYVDSGAMYRAVTLYFLNTGVDLENPESVHEAMEHLEIHFENAGSGNRTFLNGEDVENEIRQMRVSEMVSPVAAISEVRRAMVKQQQKIGKKKAIVMDGRDIGTVVFPDAELKIFLTADPKIRAQRRYDELQAKGQMIEFEEVEKNLRERDHIDSTRADSPLRQAEDARVLDNSYLTPQAQLDIALEWALEAIRLKTKSPRDFAS